MSQIPVTRARGMGPLPALLERAQGARAVDRVFASVELPLSVIETPHQQVPLATMVNLFEAASRAAGDALFGLRVGLSMPPGSYGLWVGHSLCAPTLGEALERLSRTLVLHQSGGRLELQRAGGDAVWSYVPPKLGVLSGAQHADHILPVMISVMRVYAWPGWLPAQVRMGYADPGQHAAREDLLPVDWRFNGRGVSIRFDADLLAAPRMAPLAVRQVEITRLDAIADAALISAHDPATALEAIVILRLLDGRTDIDGAARLAGLSVRSLQRRLSGLGLSYSQLLDRARRRKAHELLTETDLPIAQIAQSLGYSDQANFSRAFTRMTGSAPGQYRCLARLASRL